MITLLGAGQGNTIYQISYFVRPAGTTYGTGDGTSYANAWSGFSNVNQSILENKNLKICGTHYESFTVTQGNFTIDGDYLADPGIIDGQSLRVPLNITSYNNITVNVLTCKNGLNDTSRVENSTGCIFNYCVFDTSTNQTTQHGGAICVVEYNNCTFRNGADDGISSHDANTIITANNCTFENNVQAINAISSGIVYANDCNFINNTQDLKNDNDSQIIATRCTLRNQIVANSTANLQLLYCNILSGQTLISSVGSLFVFGCKYTGSSYITSNRTDITKVRIRNSFFEMYTQTKINLGTSTAVFATEYCTFKHLGTTNVYSIVKSGTGVCVVDNCNFIGNSNVGRGIQATGNLTVRNSIFQGLNLCVNPNGAGVNVTFENCNTYLNTTINTNQGGATFTNTNNITTNPMFTNIATNDYRLQVGSGAIGTGATLTNAVGIELADWNSLIPSVTTKNQSASWNRGAYVN